MNIKIGRVTLHNKEQWDLECIPLICAHLRSKDRNTSTRIFCIGKRKNGKWFIKR